MISLCLQFRLVLCWFDDNLFFCLPVKQHHFTRKLSQVVHEHTTIHSYNSNFQASVFAAAGSVCSAVLQHVAAE